MPNNNPNQPKPNKDKKMDLTTASQHIKSFRTAFEYAFMKREQEILCLIICLIVKKNIAIIGNFGEGKSQLSEQFANNLTKSFYGIQFNRYTTPDEAIGHFSLAEMKNNDEYIRKTKGKLADNEIIYIDEGFNASGPMLQTLQKALNEKRVDLGNGTEKKIPLEMAIVSTNFHISKEKLLAALWDRFFLRIVSKNLFSKIKEDEFMEFISKSENGELGIVNCKLDNNVIDFIRSQIPNVNLSKEIHKKLFKLVDFCNSQKPKINISPRRMIWIVEALKAMALINGRLQVLDEDLAILKHALWVHAEEIPTIADKIDQMKKVSVVKELKDIYDTIKKQHKEYLNLKTKIQNLNQQSNKTVSDMQQLRKLRNQLNSDSNKMIDEVMALQQEYSKQVKNACDESKDLLESIGRYANPDSSVLAMD